MRIYLRHSWALTDEPPMSGKGTPVLVDLDTWEVYDRKDTVGAVSALQVVSLAVEEMGKNNFLPEEIHFISRFKGEDHERRSVRAVHTGKVKKLTKKKKKVGSEKFLSNIRDKVRALEFLNVLESVLRFERTSGRKPTRDERKEIVRDLHLSLDVFCELLKNTSSDDIGRVIGLA